MDSPTHEAERLYLEQSPSSAKSNLRNTKDHGWTWLLLLAAATTTIGAAVPFGYNIGVINTPSPLIKKWCNESLSTFDLDVTTLDLLWSSIVSVFLVGGMIGSLAGSWCADYAGRRGALVMTTVLGISSAIMFFICRPLYSVLTLIGARFLIGLSSGLTMSVMPMYLIELAPDSVRSAIGVLTVVGVCFGVLAAQFMGLDWVLGTEAEWHYLLSFYLLLILILAVALPILPESPKYLYSVRGSKQKALQELSRLRGVPASEVAHELEGGETEGESTQQAWSIASLLASREMRLPLALVCSGQAGQQFSGINAVFFYSTIIFQSAGLSPEESQYANLGAGLINFGIAAVMVFVASKCRRRPLMIVSCFLTTIMLVLLTISISLMDKFSWMAQFAIFCVLGFVLVYGIGLGPIPYFIASELFDVGPRPAAMAVGSMANWTGNFFVGLTFPTLQRLLGQYSFLLFATSTAFVLVFNYLKLPETFNKSTDSSNPRQEKKPLRK